MLKFSSVIANYRLEFSGKPVIMPESEIKIKLIVRNKFLSQKVLSFKWHLPEGWEATGNKSLMIDAIHCGEFCNEFTIKSNEFTEAKNSLILEINCEGHHDCICIPVMLLG